MVRLRTIAPDGAGTLAGLAVASTLVLLILAACGGGPGERGLRDDLAAMQAAINENDATALFDEYSDASCVERSSRDVLISNFEQAPYQLTDLALRDQNIHIEGDTAYLILTGTFTFANGVPDTRSFFETLRRSPEDDRWLDEDCFQGGLGGRVDPP